MCIYKPNEPGFSHKLTLVRALYNDQLYKDRQTKLKLTASD